MFFALPADFGPVIDSAPLTVAVTQNEVKVTS